MTVQAWLVFTPAQVADTLAANEATDFKVVPRVIDNTMADQMGDPLVTVGNSVAPANVLNGPEYGPVWSESLGSLPIRTLDSDVLFLPPVI
jgi:hypothetical protein